MSDKKQKQKYNFTPKSLLSKNHKKANINLQEEIKKNLYQNYFDLRKKKSNQINDNYSKNNNILTDIITTNNGKNISSDNISISQILNKYLEGIQKNKNKNNKTKNISNEKNNNSDSDTKEDNREYNDDKVNTYNNSSELKYLMSKNKIEKINFISTLLKLKGMNSDRKEKYLYENYNSLNKNNKSSLKYSDRINQKKIFITKIANNNVYSKSISDRAENYDHEKKLTDENDYIKEYSYIKKNKNKSKNKDKGKEKDNSKNKTISKKKRNCVKEVTINLMDSDETYIKRYNNSKKEKSFDKKRNNENKKNITNKINIIKTKSHNKSPISNNIFKTKKLGNDKSYKNIRLCLIKGEENKKKKNSFQEKSKRKSNEEIKNKSNENKKRKKSNDKNDKKEEKKVKKFKIFNEKYKNSTYNNYNNFRNYDPNKLKRVQNHKFSVIDELDEEAKGDTIIKKSTNIKNENKNKENKNENDIDKEKEKNISKKANQFQNEINQINNNKYGFKNNNISLISNETFSNEIGFTDKKLLTSFFSTSTFNNDLVNYKPNEKNSSNLLINNNNINNNNNNLTNINFSIINNSSINCNNNSIKNDTLLTENNNFSKNKEKLVGSVSDEIHLNPENDEKINFLIENNSKIINEINSNNISEIIPLENKDVSLDYKINVYDNNKLKGNEITKEISSDDEGESIIDQIDIINHKIQNESKEIKLSQLKNKESDNNNISNSNINLSITNLSKFTNFMDSNIKFGEMSRISNKMNIKNNDLKKNNNMEVIKELEQNISNNNTKGNDLNKINEVNIKRIEHKKVKKYNSKNNNNNKIVDNDIENSNDSIYINTEENDNNSYFFIKNIEKNNNKVKEPKDSIRKDEPQDNYRNKNKMDTFNNKKLKQKYKSMNSSNKKIFEDEDFNPTNKLVNTNRKDIVNINNNILTDINDNTFNNVRIIGVENNNTKKIYLKDNMNKILINDKKLMYSPLSIKLINSNNTNNKLQFNNIKLLDKKIFINNKNKTVNEQKSNTLKIYELKNLNNIANINNPKKSSDFFHNYSPSPLHGNIYNIYDNYNLNENNNMKMKDQRNFYLNNNDKILYNNISTINNNIINNINDSNEEIINYYYQNNQISPKVMNINNIYKISEPYNVYIQ